MCGNFCEYNKYQKIVLEKMLDKYNIDYRRIVVCSNYLIEGTHEFRIDVLVTNKCYKAKEKVLDITNTLVARRKKQGEFDLFIDYLPDYTQLIYVLSYNVEETDRIQRIKDYYGLSFVIDKAKSNIEKRKKDIFKSYEYIPKTGNPTFDRDDKAYWDASKFEGNEYDKVLQNMSRFEFVMFHNRYNMDDPAYCYEPFNVTYTYNDIKGWY